MTGRGKQASEIILVDHCTSGNDELGVPIRRWATLFCGNSPSTSIFYTVNGGKNWSEISAPGNSSIGLVGVSFPSASTGYLVSQAGMLFRTTDGGMTFSPVDQQAVHTRNLQFATLLMGWEVRGVDLFETRDGVCP